MKRVAYLSVIISVILALMLVILVNNSKKKEQERREELNRLDGEMYEEIKSNDNYFNNEEDKADKELNEKLKKYNFYQKLAEKIHVNVLFLGNAVTDGVGVVDYNQRWVNRFVNAIETDYGTDLSGYNLGRVDSDAFYGYNALNFIGNQFVYDLVIICYGADDDPSTFSFYYDGLLRSIKNQNRKCEIYCLIEANPSGYNENADAVRDICEYYGGVCIDVNNYFLEKSIKMSDALDGIIPNEKGNLAYFNCIMEVVNKNLKEGRVISDKFTPNFSTSESFDNYRVYERSKMEQKINTVYEFNAKGSIATLIFSKSYTDGGSFRVYVNGKKVSTVNNVKDDNSTGKQTEFQIVATGLEGVNQIRVETGTAENALNFYGVAMSGS